MCCLVDVALLDKIVCTSIGEFGYSVCEVSFGLNLVTAVSEVQIYFWYVVVHVSNARHTSLVSCTDGHGALKD